MILTILTQLKTKVRNVVNAVRRPSAVTAAQRKSVQINPRCAACAPEEATMDKPQGHHVQPYNKFPALAAELSNFISLCEHVGGPEHHLHVGHGGDFKHYNPNVVADAAAMRLAHTAAERQVIVARCAAARQVDEP